jgi:hypothetical protein
MIGTLCSHPWVATALLAARGLGVGGRRQSASTEDIITWGVVGGVAIAAIAAAIWIGTRVAHQRKHNSHATLFAGLCRVHGLDRNARRLLRQVVATHNVAQPSRVFTEPQWLDPANARGPLQSQIQELKALRSHLFTEPKKSG